MEQQKLAEIVLALVKARKYQLLRLDQGNDPLLRKEYLDMVQVEQELQFKEPANIYG
jgi:hypothetical protein